MGRRRKIDKARSHWLKHPHLSAKEIARYAGCSTTTVYKAQEHFKGFEIRDSDPTPTHLCRHCHSHVTTSDPSMYVVYTDEDTPVYAHNGCHMAALAKSDAALEQVTEGRKDDSGKLPFELIAPEILFALATILKFGVEKYDARNWELGMSWGRVFGASMRHLWAWWAGKGPTSENFVFGTLDDETGYSHLWHAACCIMFLVAYEDRKTGTDDRP